MPNKKDGKKKAETSRPQTPSLTTPGPSNAETGEEIWRRYGLTTVNLGGTAKDPLPDEALGASNLGTITHIDPNGKSFTILITSPTSYNLVLEGQPLAKINKDVDNMGKITSGNPVDLRWEDNESLADITFGETS